MCRVQGRREDYRKLLTKEFDSYGQQVKVNAASRELKAVQAKVAAEIASSYLESKETKMAVEWTTRAAELGHVDSWLQLADWYENGTNVTSDPKKANHYRYLGHKERGITSYAEQRYKHALPDLQKVCATDEADANDHNKLGMCYGKLGRWDEAIKAYTRGIDLDPKSELATGVVYNLLEALIVAERPEQLLQFVQDVEKKGWKLPTEGAAAKYNAIYHGYRAIALLMSGKDASEAERAMRQFTGKPDFKITGWTWDEIDQWLKTTKLAPDRKAAVQKIVAELRGTKSQKSS